MVQQGTSGEREDETPDRERVVAYLVLPELFLLRGGVTGRPTDRNRGRERRREGRLGQSGMRRERREREGDELLPYASERVERERVGEKVEGQQDK